MAEIIWDSELGPSWPDDWEHTTVHAQFVAVTGDGADSNRLPDIAPSGNGEVIFTPSLRTVRYVGADGPYVVSLKQYRAVVDSEGYLCTPDTFGQPGERGIVLPSTDAPVIEPRGEDDNAFTWRVDFDIPAVTIRSDHIAVPVDGPYNLVDLLSPERAAGVVHIIDRVSARDAIQAASDATAARDLVLPARDETLAARDETLAHSITVDTSVGTRVFVGDTMIYGDTGWRALSEWDTEGNVTGHQLTAAWEPTPERDGGIYIRRVNEVVYYSFRRLERVATSPTTVWDTSVRIPASFRGEGGQADLSGIRSTTEQAYMTVNTSGIMARGSGDTIGENGVYDFTDSIVTSAPWPTSLPGVPA